MTVSGAGLASGSMAGALRQQGLALSLMSKTLARIGDFSRQVVPPEAHKGTRVNVVV